MIATRNLFAWSLDRILPDKMSEVDSRTHSPVVAIEAGARLGASASTV